MTPQFTTSCYIRIDDAQQRKEVCEKLEQMGYSYLECTHKCRPTLRKVLFTNGDKLFRVPISDAKFICKGIECDSIPLFLDLAGMRSDTDYMQKFTDGKNWYIHFSEDDNSPFDENANFLERMKRNGFHKATVQEIINHHKQKGEKE